MSATWRRRFFAVAEADRRAAGDRRCDDPDLRRGRAAALGSRLEAPRVLASMLDHLDASGRFALLKLATGALRVGINARLAKQALADAFGLDVDAVEEVWHGLTPPFAELFDWAEGRAAQPTARDVPVFRPFMLAHPLEETKVSLDDYAAEWKWDGIRVQLVHAGGQTRLYSRTGDDISRQLSRRRRSVPHARRARRRTAGARVGPGGRRRSRRRGGELQRASAAARAQDGQPEDARRFLRSSGSTTSCSTATRTCAGCRGTSGASGSKRFAERARSERFDVSQLIEARASRSWRTCASTRATSRSRGSCSSAATALMSPAAGPGCGTSGSAIR